MTPEELRVKYYDYILNLANDSHDSIPELIEDMKQRCNEINKQIGRTKARAQYYRRVIKNGTPIMGKNPIEWYQIELNKLDSLSYRLMDDREYIKNLSRELTLIIASKPT
jgi:hypothetical protein